MTKCHSGGTFVTTRKPFFLRTINTHGLRKVRFLLPEVAVSLIILQIRQALPQNKISSKTLKLLS